MNASWLPANFSLPDESSPNFSPHYDVTTTILFLQLSATIDNGIKTSIAKWKPDLKLGWFCSQKLVCFVTFSCIVYSRTRDCIKCQTNFLEIYSEGNYLCLFSDRSSARFHIWHPAIWPTAGRSHFTAVPQALGVRHARHWKGTVHGWQLKVLQSSAHTSCT